MVFYPTVSPRALLATAALLGLACLAACLGLVRSAGSETHVLVPAARARSTDIAADLPTAIADACPACDAMPGTASASVHSPRKVWSISRFVNDLRRPRAPKVRGDRPTTGADGIEAMMTASLLKLMLAIDMHRPFFAAAAASRPLAGHYRSLLRPPSLCG